MKKEKLKFVNKFLSSFYFVLIIFFVYEKDEEIERAIYLLEDSSSDSFSILKDLNKYFGARLIKIHN